MFLSFASTCVALLLAGSSALRLFPTAHVDFQESPGFEYGGDSSNISYGFSDGEPLSNITDGEQPMKKKRFPDVVIAGVSKCGTRALLELIGAHPDVVYARKEVNFYFDSKFGKGRSWYLHKMPKAADGQLVMEKTPKYFITPRAPKEILVTNPKTKVILVFKDPVQRVISRITQRRVEKGDERPVEDFVLDKNGELKVDDEILSAGRYAEHLARWTELFPPEQLLVLDGGTLVDRPWEELEKAQRFLNLSSLFTRASFVRNPRRKDFYCWRIEGRDSPKCLGKGKGRRHVEMPADLQHRLHGYFLPYDRQLVKMLGREMSWTRAETNVSAPAED